MVRCAHLLITRWVSTSVCFRASSIRTPKMAPVEPVMPMIRRRIEFLVWSRARAAATAGRRRQDAPPPLTFQPALWPRRDFPLILEQVPEFTHRGGLLLERRHVDLRELIAPVKRPTGVNDGAAVGKIPDRPALRLDARIERGRPRAADDVDGRRRIGAREQSPHHLLEVGHVNIVVHDNGVAPTISTDVTHRRDMAGLFGMAGVALVDRDSEQQPRIADLMRPGHRNAGHAGLLDVLTQQRRADDGPIATDLVRRTL